MTYHDADHYQRRADFWITVSAVFATISVIAAIVAIVSAVMGW